VTLRSGWISVVVEGDAACPTSGLGKAEMSRAAASRTERGGINKGIHSGYIATANLSLGTNRLSTPILIMVLSPFIEFLFPKQTPATGRLRTGETIGEFAVGLPSRGRVYD
jgi:hypothetical protein